MRRFLVVALLLCAAPAFADEQTDFLANAIAAMQKQRNAAMDDVVNAQAELTGLRAQLASTRKRIEELEKATQQQKETPK